MTDFRLPPHASLVNKGISIPDESLRVLLTELVATYYCMDMHERLIVEHMLYGHA